MAHTPGHTGRPGSGGGGTAAEKKAQWKPYGGAPKYGRKSGYDLSGLGGLLSGRGNPHDYTEEDLRRQEEYDRKIWERSTPNVNGVGGGVTWDRDTNTVSSALSEDNQSIYDDAYKRQGMFGGQVDYLASGGWQEMQQKRFEQMQAMYKDQDDEAALLRKESNYNTGASLTAQKMDELTERKLIDNRELGMLNQSYGESQDLLDNNILRQDGYLAQRSDLETMANGLIKMPTPDTQGNMANVSTASTRWADELNMKQLKKAQTKNKLWDSLLGGGSSLFGV